MSDVSTPKLAKWPFFLGDVLMVSVAIAVLTYSQKPLGLWPAVVCSASVGLGAWLSIIPFLAEYRGALKLGESAHLLDIVNQVNRIEAVAAQVAGATSQWQGVHEHATKAVESARQISDKMTVETAEFRAFIEKSNDVEKGRLRLEVEKLRRGEGEWLQILVRLLDNTFALFQAALRSEQPPLIEQIGQFQRVSRDVARRVGLVAFAPNPLDPFDRNLHEPADAKQPPPEGAKVEQVIATGYTFQGQLVRRSLVSIVTTPEQPVVPAAIDNGSGGGVSIEAPEAGTASPVTTTDNAEPELSRGDGLAEHTATSEPIEASALVEDGEPEQSRTQSPISNGPTERIESSEVTVPAKPGVETTSNGSASKDGQPLLF